MRFFSRLPLSLRGPLPLPPLLLSLLLLSHLPLVHCHLIKNNAALTAPASKLAEPGQEPAQGRLEDLAERGLFGSGPSPPLTIPSSDLWYPTPESPLIVSSSLIRVREDLDGEEGTRVLAYGPGFETQVRFVKYLRKWVPRDLGKTVVELMRNEIRVYRKLNEAADRGISPRIAPAFLGFVARQGRAADGFMTEAVPGSNPPPYDVPKLQLCAQALGQMHELGWAHGDAWRRNCLLAREGGGILAPGSWRAVLIDFEFSWRPDPADRARVFGEEIEKMLSGALKGAREKLSSWQRDEARSRMGGLTYGDPREAKRKKKLMEEWEKKEKEGRQREKEIEADRRERERLARLEADRRERERLARLEADRRERERLARLEAERQRKIEAEKLAKLEAERQRKIEEDRRERERLAKLEAERQRKIEAARQEDRERQMEEERIAQLDAQKKGAGAKGKQRIDKAKQAPPQAAEKKASSKTAAGSTKTVPGWTKSKSESESGPKFKTATVMTKNGWVKKKVPVK